MEISPFTARFIEAMNDRHVAYDFDATPGRKYDYVFSAHREYGLKASHAYIDRTNGDIYKSAGRAPAKGVRFTIPDTAALHRVVSISDPHGGYLYKSFSSKQ